MPLLLKTVAILMLVVGGIWILQGFNILPGSFMTGQLKWAAYGALVVVAGVVLFVFGMRKQGK
ncbi:MAG: hypothetical protein EPN64_01415 [Burkholderiaceae bacterium]|nr:MAG: hypothetical protein EPN64_01415 [Burkholderiaceae bacterium]